jgi:hypothetical protein
VATRGPLEAEVNRILWDAVEGDPERLEAKFENRDSYTLEQVMMMNLRLIRALKSCVLRIAREVDALPGG